MTVSDSEIAEFHSGLTDYGSMDVRTAIKKFQEVELRASDLADEVRKYVEFTGTEIAKVDICYVAYDYILQMARDKIDRVLCFDLIDSIKNGAGFYTYGNAMCTFFDYSEEATEQLTEKLKEDTPEQLEELLEDNFVKVFLEDVSIDIKEIQKVEIEA